ncbi:MAG: amidohydrolase [Desulfocapsa sp.]|nr:MAG: amidohydrolase [Desulfocapsa sp.]
MIIDFHTHAFPDAVAAKAIPTLEKLGNITAHTKGTVDSLLQSMDGAGIEKSVICSIATRPEQFEAILKWSNEVQSSRIIPLPSIHPQDPNCVEHVYRVQEQGFAGIKMHPYYQDYFLADETLFPFYEAISDCQMLLVAHCGYDIGFPRSRCADPAQILKLITAFPNLRFIATHFGGWQLWDEVEELLIGREIYMEISFALKYLPHEQIRRMLQNHPREYLLFGSDSPWDGQRECLQNLAELSLDPELFHAITKENAQKLLTEVSHNQG